MNNQLDKFLDEMLDDFFTNEERKSGLTAAQINQKKVKGTNWANVSGVVLLPIKNDAGESLGYGGIELEINLIERNIESDISEEKTKNLLNQINSNLVTSNKEDSYSKFRTGGFVTRDSLKGRLPAGKYSISLKKNVVVPIGDPAEDIEFFLPKKVEFEIFPGTAKYKNYNTPIDVEVQINLAKVEDEVPQPEPEPEAPPEEQPAQEKQDIYDTSFENLVSLIEEKNINKLEELYFSMFKESGNFSEAFRNFALLRLAFGIENPTENVGLSGEGFKKIIQFQNVFKQEIPNVAEKIADLNQKDKLDEYGIIKISKLDENEEFNFYDDEIRKIQYKKLNLFILIQDPLRNAYDYLAEVEEAERETQGIAPLNPDKNDPRVQIGDEQYKAVQPELSIQMYDADKNRIPDNDDGLIIYGAKDPLKLRTRKVYDLKKFTRTYFKTSPMQFFREIAPDVSRQVVVVTKDGKVNKGGSYRNGFYNGKKLEKGDNVVAGSTFHPIHVAMAIEEFNQLSYKNSRQGEEYKAILAFDSTSSKQKYERQSKKKDLKYIPDGVISVPEDILKTIEKRIAYFGVGASNLDRSAITGKLTRGRASFKGRTFDKDIDGVLDAVIQFPGFVLSDKAKDYIQTAIKQISTVVPVIPNKFKTIPVKTTDGRPIFKYVFRGDRYFLSAKQRDQVIIDYFKKKGVEEYKISPLTIKLAHGNFSYIQPLEQPGPGNISMPSIFIVPAKPDDESALSDFTKAEQVLAQRLGLRLDRDYRFDLNSGISNFQAINYYNENGEKLQAEPRFSAYSERAAEEIPDSPGSQIGTEEFRRKNKRTIELSEKSGVAAGMISAIMAAEKSSHDARAVNANQLYRDKHKKKLISKYNVPEDFFKKVEELRKEKNLKWNQGMRGISYNDHRKDDSVFEMLYKLNPIAAIYVSAWGNYQIMGWNFVKDIDSLFGSPQEFKRIFTEGTREEQEAASDKLFVYNHTVNPMGRGKVSAYNKAVKTGKINDWYNAAKRYYGPGVVGLEQRASDPEKKREPSEIKKYFILRSRGEGENKKYFVGKEEVSKQEYLNLIKRREKAWFVGDGELGASGVIYGFDTFRYAKTLERAGRKWEKESRGEVRNKFRVLIFGHSQAGRIGRKQESLLKKEGAFVKRLKTGHGQNDKGLFEKLRGDSDIKRGRFSHAILHLHGNDYDPVEDQNEVLLESSKKKIVDYVINNLKVPQENISIYVPPYNIDYLDKESKFYDKRKKRDETNMCSKRRKDSSKRCFYSNREQSSLNAIKWFRKEYPKANVPDLIYANSEAFSNDGYHIKGDSEASGNTSKQSLSKILKSRPKKSKLSDKEPRHSYIVGDLSADGKIYRSLNENDNSDTSGASMNKPVLALIHLMKYPNAPERMTDAELKGLLTYTLPGHESNNVNRLISGRDPLSKKLKARRNEIGKLTKEDTKEYLAKLGLDPEMKIIYGGRKNNQQTPEQYFKFMRLIHDEKKINSLGISEQTEIIKNHMKRTVEGTSRSDREAKRWPKFEKLLRDAGYEITSLYGKGGLVQTSWNYALVINDKYLVSIYTRANPGVVLANSRKGPKRTTDTANAHHTWFDNKLIEILDGVVPRKKQKVDENLKIIYKYINEVLRGL